MTFTQALANAISVYYSIFEGRASRSEYWWPVLPMLVGYILIFSLMGAVMPMADADGQLAPGATGPVILVFVVYFVVWIYSVVMTIPLTVLTGRRLHDTNRSAWWILIALIPLIGGIILLVLLALRGTEGPNRFGDDRLNPGAGGGYGGYGGEGLTKSSLPDVPRD